MTDNKILVYVPPERMMWIEPVLADCADLELCFDRAKAIQDQRTKVVVDILQSNSQVTVDEVVQYHQEFDRIVLVNCETPFDIVSLLSAMDLPKIYFLTTGKINWRPRHMTVVEHENFFGAVQRLYSDHDYQSLSGLEPYSEKPYSFDALLGNHKDSREYVYQRILAGNFQDQHIYLKYIKHQQRPLEEIIMEGSFDWPEGAQVIPETNADRWGTGEMVWFDGKGTASSCIVPVDIYNRCAYSIVTETRMVDDHVFITEKTAKCLIARRLFVMFAGPGYLQHLRDLGFQTFGHIIDESYDDEADPLRRWSRAFDQVERLMSWPQQQVMAECRSVLEHNYGLFVSRDWESKFHDDIRRAIRS
jgi:hypothetical protein